MIALAVFATPTEMRARDIPGPITMTMLDGSCAPGSNIEKGVAGGDFRDHSKIEMVPVQCDGVMVTQLANGRVLIGFVNRAGGDTLPAFGGPPLSRDNGGVLNTPIEHVYRNLPSEQPGKSPALDAEGICMLEKVLKDVAKAKAVRCIAKYEDAKVKEIYKIEFNAFRGESKRF